MIFSRLKEKRIQRRKKREHRTRERFINRITELEHSRHSGECLGFEKEIWGEPMSGKEVLSALGSQLLLREVVRKRRKVSLNKTESRCGPDCVGSSVVVPKEGACMKKKGAVIVLARVGNSTVPGNPRMFPDKPSAKGGEGF